ncbi:hypothetical protein F4692_000843 [Nocardioides cavernae]|uniref:DUF732 domain-containing protein n=1 Tax=Nocardioides cavernae TaxID=1921566 RepID=A0A7Y9H259_9ACTN|nr:hypothetical protein [Nocardioides cavernae]NYE35739.1 hypothetical protein [Nocardioides cavernae]
MRKTKIAAAALLVTLSGCTVGGADAPTGDPEKTLSAEPTENDEVDAVSGRPLSDFEGSPTYEWRATISEDPEGLVGEMQAVAPHLGEGDLDDLLGTCESIERGTTGQALVDESVARFSGSADEPVTPDQAEALIGIAQDVCP